MSVAGLHYEAQRDRAREAFRECRGEADEALRAAEIAALPVVEWKGKRLHTILCTGTTGRGPHFQHVPPALLWALMDLRVYRCPFHA